MQIKIHKKIKLDSGLLLAPIFKDQLKNIPGFFPKTVASFITERVKKAHFKGKKAEFVDTFISEKNLPDQILLAGLGDGKKYNSRFARELGGKIGKYALAHKIKELSVLLNEGMVDFSEEFLQGLMMVQYTFDHFKNQKKEPTVKLERLDLISETGSRPIENAASKAELVMRGINLTRDLVNYPSNVVNGERLAKEARLIAHENKYKIVILGNKELEKLGCGGILAVNKGSKNDAKLIVLEYDGGKRKEKPIVLIGKGVIFDTGGLNLKPTNSIEEMHQDMAGGATVLGIFKILKQLGIKKNVIGVIPVVENMVSETSYRPSDIVKMFSGKTVEITNTDAEGRMILADAITYGAKLNPEFMITVATLTGAVAIALGDRYCGLMGNDPKVRSALQKAGRAVDDLGWPLPIHRDFKKKMKSEIADLRNYDPGTGRYAGSEKGAAFLENFVEKNRWCHIDIGGTAFTDDPKEYETKGATAHSFRMLVRFLEGL